ncbi:bifunctional adenosylcobinamide kinase/adenosylcobinamide-phosphate guanylyltransferase, partial [Methylophaga sp. 41_12_T18]
KLASQHQGDVTYIATATIYDDEMAKRVKLHRDRRDKRWQLIEEPMQLAQCLQTNNMSNKLLLIDCMTLWLSNWLCQYDSDEPFTKQKEAFLQSLKQFNGDCIIVSNEVGSGIVPMGELSRRFVDQAGWLNQALAEVSDKTTLVVAGLPLALKDNNQ